LDIGAAMRTSEPIWVSLALHRDALRHLKLGIMCPDRVTNTGPSFYVTLDEESMNRTTAAYSCGDNSRKWSSG
jgi:hypothetical protein